MTHDEAIKALEELKTTTCGSNQEWFDYGTTTAIQYAIDQLKANQRWTIDKFEKIIQTRKFNNPPQGEQE